MTIHDINYQLGDTLSQMDDMYLTLCEIKKMIDDGVCIEEISNNEIKFIKGTDEEPCTIKSDPIKRFSPYEVKKAIHFIRDEYKQKLAEDAEKFNLLVKEEKRLKRNFDANIDFI